MIEGRDAIRGGSGQSRLKGLRVCEVLRYVQEGQVNPVYAFASGEKGDA